MKQIVQPILFVAFWMLAATGLQAQIPAAFYPFSGNTKDISSHANHGSANGASLTQDRFGWANNAISFDGVQGGVSAPNAAYLNSASTTISFWIKPTAFPAQGEAYIFSNGGWQERLKMSLPAHGKVVFTTHAGGACCSDMDSGTPLELGKWSHVVAVHDGAKDIIYINGVKANEKAVTGALDATTKPLGIGYDPIDNANYFNGAMDEVMVFDVALTAVQIAALYTLQNTAPTVATGKIASYSFSGNGKDDSAFANHADIQTATLVTDRFGYGNSAISTDGKTSAVTAANSGQQNSATTTISFWVKPNEFPGSGEVFILSNGGWQERWKISMPAHGKPVFTTHNAGACCSDMDSGTPLTIGKWTHVVMVHDGAKDIIYFDGVKVNEKAVTGALDPTTKPLGIGWDPIDKGSFFNGSLDEIQIYNTALSAAEISNLYTAQSTAPAIANNLVAMYNLNGDGDDDSQFHNDADLDAAAVPVTNRHGWAGNAISGNATADNSPALNSDFTSILFWVKPNSLPGSGEVFLFSNGGWQERLKISLPAHGKTVFTTHAGGACCSDMDSGTPLTVGTWTAVAMVHDGTKDIIYFNGVQVAEKNVAGTLDKTKHPLGIGWDPIDKGSKFDGAMDDILVFNRALSAFEIAAIFAAQNQTPVVGGNLVADYKFSGDGSDATAYNNDASGVVLGKDRFGKSNKAAAFNGTSTEVTAANSKQLNSPMATVSFWVKVNALPANGESFLLSFGGWQERWKISLPQHGKVVWTTNHDNGISDMDAGTGNELPVGTWKHVVMTHDGAFDKIYMNGAKVAEKAVVGFLKNTTKPFGMGYNPIDGGNWFDGSLDEVQIYNLALTDAEILALYNLQNTPPAATDTEAPGAPLNLTAAVLFTDVQLSWFPATDNVGVVAYNVYQDGKLVVTVPATSHFIGGLTPLTDYVFGVSAVDDAGNESSITTLKVKSGEDATPDTTPPTAPSNLKGTAASNSVLFSWDASTDDREVIGYVILVDGVFFDSVSATTLSIFIGGLATETAYTFEVYAFDKAGNNSAHAEITLSTTKAIDTGEPGLVAHYPFDGNANDATPYNNHGAIGGNPVFEVPNHPNGGGQNIKFDGVGDSVLVPNAVQMISDYTTVSFWIRVDGTNIADAEAYILDFGHWSERWKISLPQHLKIVWTTNSNNAQFPNFISDMDSGDGNEMVKTFWWYVTMVHDGTSDIVYVNGQQTKIKPTLGKLNTTARPLGIGNNPIEGGQYFIGALDNLKIYNKVLTAGEIDKLYQTGTTGTDDVFGNALRGVILNISPNPTTDLLTVEHALPAGQSLVLRVFDLQGRQIDQLNFDKNEVPAGRLSLKTGSYSPGTYLLNFVLGGKNLGAVPFEKH